MQLVSPVLELFKDEDPRVRYYACEALYNIAKVANDAVLGPQFNDIFDGLCKLYADVDTEVKNGVQVLDRLMKDIVTQNASKFAVAEFIPLLSTRMHAMNPYIRQLVIAWITLLLKVPEVDMIWYMPQYLEGLFNMLGDQSRDIRHNADACLNDLLKGVTSSPPKKALQVIEDTAGVVVRCCTSSEHGTRLSALCWLYEFVKQEMAAATRHSGSRLSDSWVTLLPEILGSVLHCIDDSEEEIARMAGDMNNGLLDMVQYLSNDSLACSAVDRQGGHGSLVDMLVQQLITSLQSKESIAVRTACLQWICMLLARSPAQMLQRGTLQLLFTPIFETLTQQSDEVVLAALRVLAQIMEARKISEDGLAHDDDGKDLFTVVTHRLLRLFASDRSMLETRGRLMIRHLSGHLDPRRLYVTVARAIQTETDLEFAQQLVQTFNWILLTAKETKSLREELLLTAPVGLGAQTSEKASPAGQSDSAAQAGTFLSAFSSAQSSRSLFLELLVPWFHNPVSALALCLWAQQYELATELTARFAAFEPTIDFLTQLDQLVHLLESPVFSRLRLRLLEPQRHPALLKCLLGLAMLLPQANAFHILRERIQVVQSGLLLETQRDVSGPSSHNGSRTNSWLPHFNTSRQFENTGGSYGAGGPASTATDMASLLDKFDEVTAAAQL